MKKREIILDFTSLLDVTLIIIFFFVLFSNLDSQQNKARTDEKVQEMKTAIEEAENREVIADELAHQLEDEISIVRDESERRADNISGMLEYNKSENIKLILVMEDSNWKIRVTRGKNIVSIINGSENIENNMISAFEEAGYEAENTVFCEFIYNGSEPGTHSAYRLITEGLDDIRKQQYNYLFISETDLSIGVD
jgi:hypothetical protein